MAIKYNEGDIIDTPNGKVKILKIFKGKQNSTERIRSKCIIMFLDTGTVRCVRTEYLHKDYIADYNRPTVHGVGYIGSEIKIPTRGIINRIHNLWRDMLYRVYGQNEMMKKHYKGVEVDKRWLNFTTFLNTISNVEGYENWERQKGEYELDKDIKFPGNKLYSVKTCKFVTKAENMRDAAMRRWHGTNYSMLTAND